MTALAIACALSISAEAEWVFLGLEHCLAKRSCPRLIMTILVAMVMAVGFVLPSFAQMPAQHEHSANTTEMSPATMGHHHAMRTANSGPAKQSGACGKFCPLCAMTCCGAILPVMATISLGTAPPHTVFAAEPSLGRGVLASLDPYPPRRTAQS